jgi:hypothetical protein
MRENPPDQPGRSSRRKAYAQSVAIVDEIGRRSHALREDAAAAWRRAKWKSRASFGSSPAKCTLIVSLQVAVGSNTWSSD